LTTGDREDHLYGSEEDPRLDVVERIDGERR